MYMQCCYFHISVFQLLYEQHEGGGNISLITLHPNQIDPEDKAKFDNLKLEIPSMRYRLLSLYAKW